MGILVRPQAYDDVCMLVRGIEEAHPFASAYAPIPKVVTHPKYQLDKAMLFSSQESMRKFLEMLDDASQPYGTAGLSGTAERTAANCGEAPHDPVDGRQRVSPEEGSDVS
jgi:hypothetical protein